MNRPHQFLLLATSTIFCAGMAASLPYGLPVRAAQSLARDTDKNTNNDALLAGVIANQKKEDAALSVYEYVERKEIYKDSKNTPEEIKVSRVIPVGTGSRHIPLGDDSTPDDFSAYRENLQKIAEDLEWNAQDNRAQRNAYEKVSKRQKQRNELIDATKDAFLFTFVARETRDGRLLTKYHMEPNPGYHATSTATKIFSKARGDVWIDEATTQLARIEVQVFDDISIAGFLAKVYKGSHFVEERREFAPGLWLPAYYQYDFDGRKLFSGFAVHERATFSRYRYIGPPKEALVTVRAELAKPGPCCSCCNDVKPISAH